MATNGLEAKVSGFSCTVQPVVQLDEFTAAARLVSEVPSTYNSPVTFEVVTVGAVKPTETLTLPVPFGVKLRLIFESVPTAERLTVPGFPAAPFVTRTLSTALAVAAVSRAVT